MEVRYRKEISENYLILKHEEKADEYAVRILAENRIQGVLDMQTRMIDGEREYYFAIGGKQSLKKMT